MILHVIILIINNFKSHLVKSHVTTLINKKFPVGKKVQLGAVGFAAKKTLFSPVKRSSFTHQLSEIHTSRSQGKSPNGTHLRVEHLSSGPTFYQFWIFNHRWSQVRMEDLDFSPTTWETDSSLPLQPKLNRLLNWYLLSSLPSSFAYPAIHAQFLSSRNYWLIITILIKTLFMFFFIPTENSRWTSLSSTER